MIIVIPKAQVKLLSIVLFAIRERTAIRRVMTMKFAPKSGMSAEESHLVDASNRISFADARMPAVLATPWLIAYMEYAARRAIEPCLEDNERSVGTFLEVEHLAPVPEGLTIHCRARVIHTDGPVITFQIDAHDGIEPAAKGLHKRRVIDVDRFAKRVEKKRTAARES
jgi:predicted thioesterase